MISSFLVAATPPSLGVARRSGQAEPSPSFGVGRLCGARRGVAVRAPLVEQRRQPLGQEVVQGCDFFQDGPPGRRGVRQQRQPLTRKRRLLL